MFRRPHGSHGLERLLAPQPVEVTGYNIEFVAIDRPEIAQGYQLVVVRIWKVAKQQRINQTVHGRGDAHAETDRDAGYEGKTRRFPERSQRVAEILQRGVDPCRDVDGTHLLSRAERAAK